jgi:lipopolysaccharide/colanic/teichoic acid biosynthesis glycosyltransferase
MRRRFLVSVLFSDLAALAAGVGVASLFVFDTALPWRGRIPPDASIWPLLGFLLAGALIGSYASLRMWAQHAPRAAYGRAVAIVAFTGAFTAIGVVMSRGYWSRSFVTVTLAAWGVLALGHRAVRRKRPWSERMVLVTSEKDLVEDLRSAHHAEVVEVLDPAAGPPDDLDLDLDTTLVVDLRPVMSDAMAQFVSSSHLAGHQVRALSSIYEEHTGRLPMVHLVEGWELSRPVSRNEYALFKRGVDIVLVLATLPVWVLLAALIWPAVRLDSRGPAIYTQTRVRKDNATFTLYKFRTMVVDAEEFGPRFAAVGDDRLTRVGRVLRRFRLDEIPQLWNVLRGDLSVVGPRPERPEFTDHFEKTIPFYGYRHLVRPGVTGWAQVNYGYADDEADTVEKLTYDLFYVKHMSPWLDAQILGRSIWTVLSGFGSQ